MRNLTDILVCEACGHHWEIKYPPGTPPEVVVEDGNLTDGNDKFYASYACPKCHSEDVRSVDS